MEKANNYWLLIKGAGRGWIAASLFMMKARCGVSVYWTGSFRAANARARDFAVDEKLRTTHTLVCVRALKLRMSRGLAQRKNRLKFGGV